MYPLSVRRRSNPDRSRALPPSLYGVALLYVVFVHGMGSLDALPFVWASFAASIAAPVACLWYPNATTCRFNLSFAIDGVTLSALSTCISRPLRVALPRSMGKILKGEWSRMLDHPAGAKDLRWPQMGTPVPGTLLADGVPSVGGCLPRSGPVLVFLCACLSLSRLSWSLIAHTHNLSIHISQPRTYPTRTQRKVGLRATKRQAASRTHRYWYHPARFMHAPGVLSSMNRKPVKCLSRRVVILPQEDWTAARHWTQIFCLSVRNGTAWLCLFFVFQYLPAIAMHSCHCLRQA